MNDKEKTELDSVIDHLERSVGARKALLKAVPAPKIEEQALVQMQAMLSEVERGADGGGPLTEQPEMAELRKAVHDSCALIREGLMRLTDDVSRLVKASEWHNGRSNDSAVLDVAPQPSSVVEEIGIREPQFDPNQAVHISLEAVPDFDRAAAVQQALSDMPQAASVEVIEFEDTSASIEMELTTPVNVRQIMEQLREHTRRHFLVEVARPEEHKLRVRFIEHEEDRVQNGLNAELWPKA